MLPLSSNSLQSAHTTCHSPSRFAVSPAARFLLCPALPTPRALRPCSCLTSLGLRPLSPWSTPERSPSPIIGARLIGCAYRSLTLESHSRLELSLSTIVSRYRVKAWLTLHAGDPLGSKPRSIVSGVNLGVLRRRKIFSDGRFRCGWHRIGPDGLSAHRPCSRVAQSRGWGSGYQASGEAKREIGKATFLGAGAPWLGEGKGSGVKRDLASRIHARDGIEGITWT